MNIDTPRNFSEGKKKPGMSNEQILPNTS
jgi:hypothetical protein